MFGQGFLALLKDCALSGKFGLLSHDQMGDLAVSTLEASLAEVAQCLINFLLGIHYERAVLRDWFIERVSGDEQGFGFADRFDHHPIGFKRIRENCQALRWYGFSGDADFPAVYIDEGVVAGWQGLRELRVGR